MQGIIDPIKNEFTPVNFIQDILSFGGLKENNIYNAYQGNIDWNIVKSPQVLNWSKIDSNELIIIMGNSILKNYESVYIQIGYGEPVQKVSSRILIYYWEEILHDSVQGFPVITPDKRYYFEFLNNPKVIYSNFIL